MRIVLLSLFIALGSSDHLSAGDRSQASVDDAVTVARLETMLQRLESLEQRIVMLELLVAAASDVLVDTHGVMRLPSGRPIGHWGIDGRTRQPMH